MALGRIKQLQAKKFKANYVAEIDVAISYIKDQIKADEPISPDDISEAKEIICDNLDKLLEIEGYNNTSEKEENYVSVEY